MTNKTLACFDPVRKGELFNICGKALGHDTWLMRYSEMFDRSGARNISSRADSCHRIRARFKILYTA